MTALALEPTGEADFGRCDCCGANTRRVWGFVHSPERGVAAYFVQWVVGRVADHGALFDLVLGAWGEGTTPEDRVLVTLDYRVIESGPAFMVIDSSGRPADDSKMVARALTRAEVIGQPIATDAFAVADAVWLSDPRTWELRGGPPPINPNRAWWRFWK